MNGIYNITTEFDNQIYKAPFHNPDEQTRGKDNRGFQKVIYKSSSSGVDFCIWYRFLWIGGPWSVMRFSFNLHIGLSQR